MQCDECALVYMNPQVQGDLSVLYPEEYEPYRPTADGPRRGGVAGVVRKLPVVGRLAREAMSVTMLDDSVAAELGPESRWLDIGCGNGAFLRKIRDLIGSEVFGVDISPAAVEAARKAEIDVFLGTLDDAPFPTGHFDVISGWWYLEHVANPTEVVGRIATLLKDGGLCILAVPNFASLNARAFRTRWYHLDAPRHLTLWSPRTMRRLYERSGLDVQRVRYDKSVWGLRGSLGHSGVPLARPLSAALLPWTIATGIVHLSDTIVVYGRASPRG